MMLRSVSLGILALGLASSAASAQDAEDFYKGRRITLVVGTGPGGAYDIHGRLIARHLGQHIPGAPRLIVQNMPGAGSVTAANYVYNAAAKDGSVLLNFLNTVPLVHALAQVKTQFDPAKFQWIGNMTQEVYLVLVWHTAPAQSIEQAKHAKVLMGATSPGSLGGMYPRVLNEVLGTKFQVVAGYKEAAAIDLAVQRGEVNGRAGESWYGQKGTSWEWTRDGQAKIILQIGFRKPEDLKDVPLLIDLVKDDAASRSDFDLRSLRTSDKPVSVYVVVPPENADIFGPITGALVELCGLMAVSSKGRPILFLLDEVPELPALDIVKRGPAIGRGQNVQFVIIAQDIGQLVERYGKTGFDTIMTTTAYKVVLTQNHPDTQQMISKMIGQVTREKASRSRQMGKVGTDLMARGSVSSSLEGVPLVRPEELGSMRNGDQLVIAQQFMRHPIKSRTAFYFKLSKFKRRTKIPVPGKRAAA